MEAKTVHTATPWQVGNFDKRKIFDGGFLNGVEVGPIEVATASNAKNAAFIVRACNNFQGLIDTLEDAASMLESLKLDCAGADEEGAVTEQIREIRAALAKAEAA